MFRYITFCCSLFCALSNVYADIGSDMETFFSSVGTSVNVTSPGAHKDQSAGYYSGGGVSVRNRVKNTQLATLQLPRFEAGCGGIDMFTGGFSHISKGALVGALKSIGTNAATYAFKLAIKTVSPMIDGIMENLNDLATMINQANLNSCESAATLLGGVLPKSDLTSRHLCTSMGSNLGGLSDWAAAKQGCGTGNMKNSIMSSHSNNPQYQNILAEEFNVAWEVIKRNQLLMSNIDLAYLCMTISGTIIAYNEGGAKKVQRRSSKADANLIKALLEGGQAEIYSCSDKTKCLQVNAVKQNIPASKAFLTKVSTLLNEIMEKALKDEALTAEEKAFIGNVKLPIYKMVNVLSAYRKAVFDLKDFTEIIAADFIYQYLMEILDVILEEAANLRSAQVSDEEMGQFIVQLHEAKRALNTKREDAYRQMNQVLIMIENTRIYEKKVEHTFDQLAVGGKR